MNSKSFFKNLPKNFQEEEKSLRLKGFNTWTSIKHLRDQEINDIARTSLATVRNLKRLRCIAILINEIDLAEEDAALLMHSGIASTKALAYLTPQELLHKTGRFERLLSTGRKPVVDLQKASSWIKKARAKDRQSINWPKQSHEL